MNSATFKKGEKRPGQGKRGPGKITLKGREALAAIIEGNILKVQNWLDDIERQDGAKAALEAYTKLIEFAIPRLARHEVMGEDNGPIIVKWRE